MGFKETINKDLNDTFFNQEEFSELHNVDGVDMDIIIDDEELEEFNKKYGLDYDGIYVRRKLFYVKKSIFGSLPVINSLMMLDDKEYKVESASESGGLIKIILRWNED